MVDTNFEGKFFLFHVLSHNVKLVLYIGMDGFLKTGKLASSSGGSTWAANKPDGGKSKGDTSSSIPWVEK